LFDIKEACSTWPNCDFTQQLSVNPYAWNNNANVIFLDQPRYVGYSFGSGPAIHSSVDAAKDFVIFYQGWLQLFPEFVGRPLYIAGESYGGHYIPAWADAINNYNLSPGPTGPINFAGVAIGNGCVNNTVQNSQTYIQFLEQSHLLPAGATPKTQAQAEAEMISYIGYRPNYYDFRLQSVSCGACYSYNYTAWAHWFLKPEVTTALSVCGTAGTAAFAGNAGGCISMGSFDANDTFDYSAALGRTLNLGIPVVFYYGKADTACDYVGGYATANTIPWASTNAFASASLQPIMLGGAQAGQMKTYGPLTFIQVEAAGHMVPLDQPAAASYAISTLLKVPVQGMFS